MKFTIAATLAVIGLASAAPAPGSYGPGYPASNSYPTTYSYKGNSQSSAPATSSPQAQSAPTSSYTYTPPVTCLTNVTAKALVDGFVGLITNYSTANAEALLSSDFTDTSDSINVLGGYPLGATTFSSKAAFEAGQGAQPKVPMVVLNIDEVTCTTVGFRWQATPNPGMPDLKVKGINSFVASNKNSTDAGWQIKTMYSEFNSCVWMKAIGGTCALPK